MTELSKKFENLLISYNKKLADRGVVMPVKVQDGIMIGNVLIKSNNNLKTIIGHGIEYKDIFLNFSEITMANLLALKRNLDRVDKIYQADQEYGRYFVESQYLLKIHSRYINSKDYEKADTVWARYQEVRDRAEAAKIKVERFLNIDK